MSVAAIPISDLRPIIPPGWKSEEPRVQTGDWSDIYREVPKAPLVWAPVWRISHRPKSFRMKQPVLVRVYTDEGLVFAKNESLAICGTGESLQEAMADFCLHAIHFYEYYGGLPESKLMGEAVKLKRLYADLFVEE